MAHRFEDIRNTIGLGDNDKLVLVKQNFYESQKYTPEQVLALETALTHGAHYLYFRSIPNRPPFPHIYIFDHSEVVLEDVPADEMLNELHRRLWSACPVPLFIVFRPTQALIFSSLAPPTYNQETREIRYHPLETLNWAVKAQDKLDELNRHIRDLDVGTFWDNPLSKLPKHLKWKNTVYGRMLVELRRAKESLIRRRRLKKKFAQRMLVMSLLVRYLEERQDDNKRGVFPKSGELRGRIRYTKGFFEEFSPGATCFADVLRQTGAAVDLFDKLAEHFKGDVFRLTAEEREYLGTTDLSNYANFLSGQDSDQLVLWPLYSFEHLPVELISNIYEEFLQTSSHKKKESAELEELDEATAERKRKGIVYTPPYLVDFLLSESLPLKGPPECRILDPACGSGVFLVGAYRRLIARWRIANNWNKPDLKTLQRLLRDCIHGVDIDGEAVGLTIFSLCLAICSELEPMVIWENLRFDPLRIKNIIEGDFFTFVRQGKWDAPERRFDLVIGNPPFVEKFTPDAELLEQQTLCLKRRPPVPNKQLALLFLDTAVNLLRPNGLACLIQPSAPFLYNQRSAHFRRAFLASNCVPQIIDFTHAYRVIFGPGGDVPVCAVFVRKSSRTNKDILHVTVRRSKSVKEGICFEFDHYDMHRVPQDVASDAKVWKANLLGGGRVGHLLERLAGMRTLVQFIKSQNSEWAFGEGLIVGNVSKIKRLEEFESREQRLTESEKEDLIILRKQYKKAPYLTGLPFVPGSAFDLDGIAEGKVKPLEHTYFDTAPPEIQFREPLLMIKQQATAKGFPVVFRSKDTAYDQRVVGIHAPVRDKKWLKSIHDAFQNNRTYAFYVLGSSSEFGVRRSSAILLSDVEQLPFPEDLVDLELSEWEQILVDDALDFGLEFQRKGENACVMKYASGPELVKYGETYCRYLNTVYPQLRASIPRETPTHVCFPFFLKSEPLLPQSNSQELDVALEKLTRRHRRPSVRVTRIIRLYAKDLVFVIKPKQLRYWLRSVAIRDADETFTALRKQGF